MLTCFLIEAASRSIDAATLAGWWLKKGALRYLRWRADYELRRLATRDRLRGLGI
jgi:hypothetical protein